MKYCHCRHISRNLCSTLLAASLAVGAVTGVAGCNNRVKPAADDYSGQAKYAFDEAMDSYESGDHLDALKQFNYVRTKFPYSKFATLATLRVADTYFKQDQYPEAIESYRRFIQLHPTHPEVPYAQYRVGLSFYEQLPSDWFIMPPSYERDLTSTADAERELRKFLELYPNSQYSEAVSEKLSEVRKRLADHEFFVATFYLKRGEARAAAIRFEGLIANFSGVGFDEEALFLLGKCFLLLNDVEKATAVWARLGSEFPDHPLTATANDYMAPLGVAAPVPAPPAPAVEERPGDDAANPATP